MTGCSADNGRRRGGIRRRLLGILRLSQYSFVINDGRWRHVFYFGISVGCVRVVMLYSYFFSNVVALNDCVFRVVCCRRRRDCSINDILSHVFLCGAWRVVVT